MVRKTSRKPPRTAPSRGRATPAARRRPPTSRRAVSPTGDDVPRFSVAHMDRTAEPARDFYRYATGSWTQAHPVPADKTRWGAFNELIERNFRLLHGILEEAAALPRESPDGVARKVGDFYASALDTERRNRLGFRPILADLAAIERMRSNRDVIAMLARFHRAGVRGAFEPRVHPDRKQSSVYAVYLYQGGLAMPDRDYYLEEPFREVRGHYLRHVGRIFALAGDSPAESRAGAKTVLALETELAKASRRRAELRDPEKNYHPYSIEDLAGRYPHLEWPRYLSMLGLPPVPGVIVGQPEFFEALDRALPGHDLSDWKAYLRWQFLHEAASFLHDEVEAEDFAFFHRRLLGQDRPEPPWRRAATTIDRAMGEALGELYVRRHFPPEARSRMEELVRDLRTVFRERLARLEWMSPVTRTRALEKFDRFTSKIGHPERFRDYSSVRISRTDYLGNLRRASGFEVRRQLQRAGGPVDRAEWFMTPPTVNAYFDPSKNEIVFPAGILQPPFFDVTLDDAVNFGAIGAVIGHEITHGYDDQGRKYDASGNLRDWWAPSDAAEFTRRSRRIVDQFGSYEPLRGTPINGELTMGENIADLGGISIAFEALERRLADGRTPDGTHDGLTPRQRFFLAYAQLWRENTREPDLRRRLTIDPHSPGPYRAIGPLVNFPPFWEAFRIPPGAPMRAPEERRVSIW